MNGVVRVGRIHAALAGVATLGRIHAVLAVVGFAVAGCADGAGTDPGGQIANLAIVPRISAPAAVGLADVQTVEILVRGSDGRLVGSESQAVQGSPVDLLLQVRFTPPCEMLAVDITLRNSSGQPVFRSSATQVELCEGTSAPLAEPELNYFGVGANAVAVVIDPQSAEVLEGESFTFVGEARDADGTAIPGTPIRWSTLDPGLVSIPDPGVGRVVANNSGTARIQAELLTGQVVTAILGIFPDGTGPIQSSGG